MDADPTTRFLAELLDRLRRGDHAASWQEFLRREAITGSPNFVAWVRGMYGGAPLLSVNGHDFPCAVFEAAERQRPEPDSVVSWDELGGEVGPRVGVPEYVRYLVERAECEKIRVFDGAVAAMVRLDTGSTLRMTCRRGSYYHALESCDALKLEVQQAWSSGVKQPVWRDKLHRRVPDPLCCGDHRCAAVAVSTVVCVRTEAGWRGLMRRISPRKLAVEAGRLHVVPAGMMEPPGRAEPLRVTDQVLRELGEELLGDSAGEGVAEIQQRMRRGEAGLMLSGVAVNLLNLRPEICTLLWVDDPRWLSELKRRRFESGEYEGELIEAPLDGAALGPAEVAVAGAAALELGSRIARRMLR